MIKRILVGLSGSTFTPASITHAVELAQRHGAEVTGVTDLDLQRLTSVGPVPLGAGEEARRLADFRIAETQNRIEECIDQLESACVDAGITHRTVRETGHPFDQLRSLWHYHDLTVLGLRGIFEYGVLDNPTDEVIRLINDGVRPILTTAEEHREIRTVVVAYNGSMESAAAMKRFARIDPAADIKVHLVTFDEDLDKGRLLLHDAAAYLAIYGYDTTITCDPGDPRRRLLPLVDELGGDLIVMGATGRSNLARFVLGDTAAAALKNATVPIFLSR